MDRAFVHLRLNMNVFFLMNPAVGNGPQEIFIGRACQLIKNQDN